MKRLVAYNLDNFKPYHDDYDENMYFIENNVKTPQDLNKILNKFDYGFVDSSGFDHVGFDLDFDEYTTMEPRNVLKYAVGVCWDYVETEAFLFNKLFNYKITNKTLKNGTYSLYYMQHEDKDGDMPTHTWLAYMENNKIYLFESSWKSEQGIKQFDNEKDMIRYYDKKQRDFYKSQGNPLTNFVCLKYMPLNAYQKTPHDYMKTVYYDTKTRLVAGDGSFATKKKIKSMND